MTERRLLWGIILELLALVLHFDMSGLDSISLVIALVGLGVALSCVVGQS